MNARLIPAVFMVGRPWFAVGLVVRTFGVFFNSAAGGIIFVDHSVFNIRNLLNLI